MKPCPIIQKDMRGTIIGEYVSIYHASLVTGLNATNIGKAATGLLTHYGGYKWEFKDNRKPYFKKDTLCWSCATCSPKCSWKRKLIPVEGWEAKPVKLKMQYKIYDSYIVKSCPLYTEGR